MKSKPKIPKTLAKLFSDNKEVRGLIRKLDKRSLKKFRKLNHRDGEVLTIHGVEITQGIQSYRAAEHLIGTAGERHDNTVRFVMGKPTYVRVYVRNLFFPLFSNVGGSLKVFKRRFGRSYFEIAEIAAESPGVVDAPLNADYSTERGSLDHTLNFIVPADIMCGYLRFDVEIKVGSLKDTYTRLVNATLQQTLNMRVIPVSYSGPDTNGNQINLPTTSLADAQSTAALCLALYPVRSTPNISLTTAVRLTFPLIGNPSNPGGCAQSWLNLNALLSAAKAADGNIGQTFYYGLVPQSVPIGANSGCSSSGVTSGRVAAQMTMAHEFGHGLGFGHSNCGNVGSSADSNIPVYQPYDPPGISMASIGEYGIDVRNGEIMPPDTTRDYMSYCGPKWISLFNYERSIQHGRFRIKWSCIDRPIFDFNRPVLDDSFVLTDDFPLPETPPDRPPWYDDYIQKPLVQRESFVSFIAIQDFQGRFELCSMTRVLANPVIEEASPTDMFACLFDETGKQIAAAPLMQLISKGNCGCGDGCNEAQSGSRIVQTMIPDVGEGQNLKIMKGQKEVWNVERPKNLPNAPKLKLRKSRDKKITLTWTTAKSDGPIEVWLRWQPASKDESKVLLIGKESGSFEIEPGIIPPGKGSFQAVNHNGFTYAVSNSVAVEIPIAPPSVAILHPYHQQTLDHGRSMRLHGLSSDCYGNQIDPKYCHWFFNGKKVGSGLDLFIPVPPAGLYKVTLEVNDKSGKSTATSQIMVINTRALADDKSK